MFFNSKAPTLVKKSEKKLGKPLLCLYQKKKKKKTLLCSKETNNIYL
jgi:hypothetical protein